MSRQPAAWRPALEPRSARWIACIGAGVIGGGWAAHFLARSYDVVVYDPAPGAEARLRALVEQAWPALTRLGLAAGAGVERLTVAPSLEAAVAEADFVQESVPERLALKREVLAAIDAALPAGIVVGSSTSGFAMSEMQTLAARPARLVVGHPFNPPYLIPLVEVVGGRASAPEAVAWAAAFYRCAGKSVLQMSRELPGFIANRLQEALWREALHMVAAGEATVAEIDAAVTAGPGLRWAIMGPCLTFHLAAGDGGMAAMLDHFGPCLEAPWTRLAAPELSAELRARLVAGCEGQAAGRSVAELARERDAKLVAIAQALQGVASAPATIAATARPPAGTVVEEAPGRGDQAMTAATPSTADFRDYPSQHRISRVERGARALQLTWDDGHTSEFHHLWLRDNCACPACIHPDTREQTFEIDSVPETIQPARVALDGAGSLTIVWSDGGHVSAHQPGWLRAHCYSEVARAARMAARPRRQLWDAGLNGRVPTFAGPAVLTDDEALLAWLRALRDTGLALLTDVPITKETVGEVAARIGFPRRTNFGTLWNVRAVLEANSNAYTALRLPLHTDLPTRELEPGLQMLHCLVNDAEGGDSLLVDGFKLAADLHEQAPEAFEVLTTVALDFHNTDWQSDYRAKAPVIRRGADGEPFEIRFGTFLKGPFDVPAGRMEDVYRAYRRFSQMTKDPANQVTFRLQAGDLMTFDNRRILHARTAFEPGTGERHLRGCYLDTDELLSRIRVLERRFPPPDRSDFVC